MFLSTRTLWGRLVCKSVILKTHLGVEDNMFSFHSQISKADEET